MTDRAAVEAMVEQIAAIVPDGVVVCVAEPDEASDVETVEVTVRFGARWHVGELDTADAMAQRAMRSILAAFDENLYRWAGRFGYVVRPKDDF